MSFFYVNIKCTDLFSNAYFNDGIQNIEDSIMSSHEDKTSLQDN